MGEAPVRTERRGKVLLITLDRPKANAIDAAVSRALYAAFERLQQDEELLVGVLASANERIFSAGWDLNEAAASYEPGETEKSHGPGGFAGIVENFTLNKPVIAAIRGAAVGGGFEMALACDIILASPDAWFQLPEMQRGFLPDVGGVQRLPRLLPLNVARVMLYTGRRMDADEAKHWGLVHEIYAAEELLPKALDMAAGIARSAPLALQALKAVLRRNEDLSLPEAFYRARPRTSATEIYERMSNSEDAQEGPRAFLEKREPRWKGR